MMGETQLGDALVGTITKEKSFSPWTGVELSTKRPFWVVDEKCYDFSKWLDKHPGGNRWFFWTTHRDITILFHRYHKDSRKLQPILDKFEIKDGEKVDVDDVNNKLGVPAFLLHPNFEARRDVPRYDFYDEKSFGHVLRERILEPELQKRISMCDKLFNILAVVFFGLYLLASISLMKGWLPQWILILLLPIMRTCLGGWGHYFVHQAKPNWGESLFDVNYVGTCLIGEDGHCLLHHPYTQSGGDVKRTFFNGMLGLAPLLRIPGYTIHKFGVFLTGIFIRGYEINFFEFNIPIRWEFWLIHVWLSLEFFLCIVSGVSVAWFLQFFISLWINTCLVVSSHDFEEAEPTTPETLPKEHQKDWSVFQLNVSFDFWMTGNRWIDLFLSAGLSPHRTHHLFPYQKSGFANLVSEPVVKQVVKEFGFEWKPARNWWTERFPVVLKHYLTSPPLDPRTSKKREYNFPHPRAFTDCISYILSGFMGIGAV